MSIDTQQTASPEGPHNRSSQGLRDAHPLQQAAIRLSDVREGRSKLKAKDLVGLLLCHGARAWRSSQPRAHMRVDVRTTAGHPAIRLRLG